VELNERFDIVALPLVPGGVFQGAEPSLVASGTNEGLVYLSFVLFFHLIQEIFDAAWKWRKNLTLGTGSHLHHRSRL
jgi:hypothetical protein